MNRLGRILRYLTEGVVYAAKAFEQSSIKPVRLLLRGSTYYSGTTVADQEFYLKLAIANPYIYNCLSLLGQRCNNPDVFLVQSFVDGEWSSDETHPFRKLLRAPNSLTTGAALLEDTVQWDGLLGNAYWLLRTPSPGMGPIEEIWPIPANLIKPEPTTIRRSAITGKIVIDYRYSLTGDLLPGENVIHYRRPNAFDYWLGLSPLSALTHNVETFDNKRNWLSTFFGEGNAVPTAVISVPPELTNEQLDEVTDSIRDQFGKKRQVAVTRGGDMSVEVIQQTMEELKIIDSLRYDAEEIRGVFLIPEGLNKAASGQSRLAAETALARDAVQPILNRMASIIDQKIMPYYGRSGDLRCIADNVVPQDRALDVTEYNAYIQDMTINEGRQRQELEPIYLTGILAPLQQLLDEVPVRYVQLLAPLLVAQVQQGLQQQSTSGGLASLTNALAQMTGNGSPSQDGDLFGTLSQMTNDKRSNGLYQSTGIRDENPVEAMQTEFQKLLPGEAKSAIYAYLQTPESNGKPNRY